MEITGSRLANSIMERNALLYEGENYHGKWSYDYGVVMKGFQLLFEETGDIKYFEFIKNNMDFFIQDDGLIRDYSLDSFNIDYINNGKLLFLLYNETGLEKYKKAADLLYSQLEIHPRTSENIFWHKKIYPYQVWLDGLYMGSPFYAEYAKIFGNKEMNQDVLRQFELSYYHLRDEETGLLIHAWDEKKVQPWADPKTGLSHHFWSRSIGWYLMAVVDTYELMLDTGTDCGILKKIISETIPSIMKYQDKSGVWYQVTTEGERKGNYLEASGSSMFVYAISKSIRLGLIPEEIWKKEAIKARDSLITEFVLETKEGWINLNKNCQVAGLGGDDNRDGSYAYYISEPIICNDLKGVGAFLQAIIETERLSI